MRAQEAGQSRSVAVAPRNLLTIFGSATFLIHIVPLIGFCLIISTHIPIPP